MTTSALKKHRVERADVVIGPYGCNHCNSSGNWDFAEREEMGEKVRIFENR